MFVWDIDKYFILVRKGGNRGTVGIWGFLFSCFWNMKNVQGNAVSKVFKTFDTVLVMMFIFEGL